MTGGGELRGEVSAEQTTGSCDGNTRHVADDDGSISVRAQQGSKIPWEEATQVGGRRRWINFGPRAARIENSLGGGHPGGGRRACHVRCSHGVLGSAIIRVQ